MNESILGREREKPMERTCEFLPIKQAFFTKP